MKTIIQFLKVVLLVGIGLFNTSLFAQNYSVFQEGKTYLYEGMDDYIYGIRSDLTAYQGGDIIYFLIKNLQQTDNYCFNPEGPSWMGDRILIHPNGESVFYNLDNEPITLKTQAYWNEEWICYSSAVLSFRATVSAIEAGEILGLPDSLKIISLQAINADGQNIQHPVNELQIVLSKNYGMQKTLNFYNFPNHDLGFFLWGLQQMTLAGFNQPEAGIQDLTWKDVNDYEIGDILHTEESSTSINYDFNIQTLQKVLGKQNMGDSIVYQIEEKKKYSLSNNGNNTFNATFDTIDLFVGSNPDFEVLPGVAYPVNNIQEGYDINHLRQGPHGINKIMGNGYSIVPQMDSCYSFMIVDGCIFDLEYIKGLGGPYYYCNYFWDEAERTLVYYKKGDIEWGTPLEFNVGINSPEHTEKELNIYPNPTNGMTTFSINGVTSSVEIRIYSITGKEVMNKTITDQALDLSFLPKGMYLVKFYGKDFYGVKKLERR